MVEFNDLYEAMLSTRSNKRRSGDSIEFEIHWERKLLALLEDINNRSFSPTAYTFVTPAPQYREIFACEFAMRVIHHYIDIRLRPILEEELTHFTYNNRKGYGPLEAINQVITNIYDVSKGFTKDAYIIQGDIEGYFPNANQDIVYQQLSDLAQRKYHGRDLEDLLYMIQISVFSYPTHHCYRKSPSWMWSYVPDYKSLFKKPDGIGGAIGHLIWQNSMNYYLNELDHWLVDEMGLRYVRFVDDFVIVVENKEAALTLLPTIREKMAEKGVILHRRKFYCQHWSKGIRFVGSYIKCDRVYLNNRVVYGMFKTVREFNRCIRPKKLKSFIASINSYLGFCKIRNNYGIIRNLIDTIDPKWWKFCHVDWKRLCIVANPGYTHADFLEKDYYLKKRDNKSKKNHGTVRRDY